MILSSITGVSSVAPLAAETIFTVGSFGVTNTMLMGVAVAVILITIFAIAAAKTKVFPKSKYAFFIESVVDFLISTLANNFSGDHSKARRFLPLFLAFFLFILLNNLLGLMPGLGGTVYVESDGVKAALLRPFTTDINGTLSLAVVAMVTVHYLSIKERGARGYFKHYFTVLQPWWNPMNLFVGLIEVLGEFIRLLTLALRLFGVIYAGEVLRHVITGLSGDFAWAATVPIIFMEIFFASIQAYLFIMLSSVYLQMGTAHDEPHSTESSDHDKRKSADAGELVKV